MNMHLTPPLGHLGGQGYRYPTVTERFISTLFGGFTIFPNPLLKPEYGWSAEVGVKQGFDVDFFKGFLDFAAFISEYEDMIEFTFQENPPGFRPINVGNTRISGAEASIAGKITIWKIPVTLLTGYTYINPIYKNFEGIETLQASLSTNQNVLKYRSKYSYKADLQAEYKMISIGLAIQHYSHMINIDKTFERPFGADLFEIEYFRNINNKGYSVADARLGVEFSDFKLSFYLNNVFNKAYTVRPALLEAPRNASIRLDYKI